MSLIQHPWIDTWAASTSWPLVNRERRTHGSSILNVFLSVIILDDTQIVPNLKSCPFYFCVNDCVFCVLKFVSMASLQTLSPPLGVFVWHLTPLAEIVMSPGKRVFSVFSDSSSWPHRCSLEESSALAFLFLGLNDVKWGCGGEGRGCHENSLLTQKRERGPQPHQGSFEDSCLTQKRPGKKRGFREVSIQELADSESPCYWPTFL